MRSLLVLASFPLALAFTTPSAAAQDPSPGYTLYAPMGSSQTHLVDSAGVTQHTWSASFLPGISVYMRPNGNLLRTKRIASGAGGVGGGIQEITWDGTVVWDFDFDVPGMVQHHDLALLPNGNVLFIAWDRMTPAEAIAAGRNPATIGSDLTPDQIVEVEKTGPTTGSIVWKWRIQDHCIQDFDAGQSNFGVVGDHPELIDINFPPGGATQGDWTHSNGIDYIEEFDQVILSSRTFNEFWIIDHSTTTAEAAGHTGGNSGKGGDLLYRWGNPQAYDRGTPADTVLLGQHDPNWIPAGFPGHGNIMVFNNLAGGNFTTVLELTPPVDVNGNYFIAPGAAFGPTTTVWEYTANPPTDFFSSFVGGAIRLRNGNTLISEGATGSLFEVDTAGTTVWSHQSPAGTLFKARRYEHNLWSVGDSVSVALGGTVGLELLAGPEHAGDFYWVLGSASGSTPGFSFAGVHVPLNPADSYFRLTLRNPPGSPLSGATGVLDAAGRGNASFALPPGTDASLAGLELSHAFAVLSPGVLELVSNPLPLQLVP